MKLLFAPDSFKGSMSSRHVISLLTTAAKEIFPDCEILSVPMADGGEGTMEVLVEVMKGSFARHTVTGPSGRPVPARYGMIDEHTAMIEMAEASGLTLISEEERNPCETSSFGTGELIAHVLKKGYSHIIMAIGGSATNDGGMGAAAALGVRFLDKRGQELRPAGKNLAHIHTIDSSHLLPELSQALITIICDVKNPLTGPNGSTFVYGPQKGGTKEQLHSLEEGMIHYANLIKSQFGKDYSQMEGCGAAGGISVPFLTFSNARLESGIQTVLNTIRFDDLLSDIDLVVTGEGQTDGQSAYGKVLAGIGTACQKKGIPAAAIVGSMGEGASDIYDYGIQSIMPIINRPMELSTAMADSDTLFLDAAKRMFRFIQMGMSLK